MFGIDIQIIAGVALGLVAAAIVAAVFAALTKPPAVIVARVLREKQFRHAESWSIDFPIVGND